MDSWAVDLANVGPVYPWQGLEIVLVIVLFAAWIAWHVLQMLQEKQDYADSIKKFGAPDAIKKAIDQHPL
jgi:hypothetical protein